MAPDIVMHHEQQATPTPVITPVMVGSLGAGQTGAESKITEVSAESEQTQQVSRSALAPQQPPPETTTTTVVKQVVKEQPKQRTLPPKQAASLPTS